MEIMKRVQKREEQFDRVQEVLERLERAFDDFQSVQSLVTELSDYYEGDWRSDFEADERGELPVDLKRGVLSEDGLYNLLTQYDIYRKLLETLLTQD